MPVPPRDPDRPRGASYWARRWGVHRDTARQVLKYLARHYGSRVAWKVVVRGGPSDGREALVASENSLQVVRVRRAGRSLLFVFTGQDGPAAAEPARRQADESGPGEELVTREEHARALSQVWEALRSLGYRPR